MTRSYFDEIEQKLKQSPTLIKSIRHLVEKSFETKKNNLPQFTDDSIHSQLLKEGIVSINQTNHYEINPSSHLLSHVVYTYLKEKLKLTELVSILSLKVIKTQIKDSINDHPNRNNLLKIVQELPFYLCVWLNIKKGYQFEHIFEIRDKKEYSQRSFDEVRPVQKALKYLDLPPKQIVAFVVHCLKINGFDGEWYINIKERYSNNTEEAWELLRIAKGHKIDLRYLIANILQTISITHFFKAYEELKTLYCSPKFRSAALLGLSYLEYINKDVITEVLKLMDLEKREDFILERSRMYSVLIKSGNCSDEQKEICFQKLEELINLGNLAMKSQLLFSISGMKTEEVRVIQLLEKYFVTGKSEETIFWHDINYSLYDFKDKNLVFSFLEHFVRKFPKENFTKIFATTLVEIQPEVISLWITKWFNEDEFLLNLKASELTRSCKTIKPILLKKFLDGYSIWDVEYVVRKILGFVVMHEQLSPLVFSVLQRMPEDENINTLVESAFLECILFNYKTPLEFLKGKKKDGTKIEKKVAARILKKFDVLDKAARSLPRLKELQGSTSRIEEYMKRQSKLYDLEKNLQEESIMMQVAKRIDLRAGKGFFFRRTDDSYSEPAALGLFRVDFELPAGEFIDPTGQVIFRATCQTFKRRK